MGIYIPNLKMPKEIDPALVIDFCEDLSDGRYARFYHYRYGGLTNWYEVLEIPEPHGRLIDVDSKTFPTFHRNPLNDYMKGWNACLRSVKQQPIIIPASEEAEE